MPESENGQQQSTPSRPRGLIDFIRSSSTENPVTLTREMLDQAFDQINRYQPRRIDYTPRSLHMPRNHSADFAEGVIRLETDTNAFTQYMQTLRTAQTGQEFEWATDELVPFNQEYPQTATEVTARIVSQDNIFNPEDDYWPRACREICPKPKTREGITVFYERHPELRGVA